MKYLRIDEVAKFQNKLSVRMSALVIQPEVFNFSGLEDLVEKVDNAFQAIDKNNCKMNKVNGNKFTFFINPGGEEGYTEFIFFGTAKEGIPKYFYEEDNAEGHAWPPGEGFFIESDCCGE